MIQLPHCCSLVSLCRDAKCGKIQCQGGANRPVIGTNAVSIETNIPLQEGGRILCRGTHVYLGDDMPDPGLVLTGTKCGEGLVRLPWASLGMHFYVVIDFLRICLLQMCLNRQCQNVSVFGVHECSAKCSGRGVSTSSDPFVRNLCVRVQSLPAVSGT